ncbi:MAG: hypothetical protein ACFFDD_03275 [Promethearchaeota archaeon]
MSKKPQEDDTDLSHLETQIKNLHDTVGALVCVVSILTVYMIVQIFQDYSLNFFIPYGLAIAIILVLLLICAGMSFFDIW